MRPLLRVIVVASCALLSCTSTKHPSKVSGNNATTAATLEGTWELDYILSTTDMGALFPDRKPELVIPGPSGGTLQGNSGCNRMTVTLKAEGHKMTFTDPVALTRMACPGEPVFFTALQRVNAYGLSPAGNELNCIQGDIVVLRFLKKQP